MLKIQIELLRIGLQKTVEKYNLRCNRHNKYNNLVELCYHQTKTPINNITNECRGIILDENNNWSIVSYPFNRFFDYQDHRSNNFNKDNFITTEKIDGSLIQMYYYDNSWNIATKGLPDASGTLLEADNITYTDYFWTIWNKLGYSLPNNEDKDKTFIFEFKFPTLNFITKTNKQTITLIGSRNNITLEEYMPYYYSDWDIVKVYDNYSFEELVAKSYTLDPMLDEGFVCIDDKCNRVKIKSPQYEAVQKLNFRESNTFRILDIIKYNGENNNLSLNILNNNKYYYILEEYNRYYNLYLKLIDKLNIVLAEYLELYNVYKIKEANQKLQIYHEDIRKYVFLSLKGSALSPHEYLRKTNNKHLKILLNNFVI